VVDKATRLIELVLGLALIAAVILNFVNVVGRYGFGWGFIAADELQTYIMVYLAFLGAAVATWRGLHLRMDVIARRFPEGMQKVLSFLEMVLVLILCGLVTWVALQYALQMYLLGAKSQTAQIPMWIPHLAVAAGFGLTVFFTIMKFIKAR
jgi:TRAP-type C4-dicarboxylate transport system permease small subunit